MSNKFKGGYGAIGEVFEGLIWAFTVLVPMLLLSTFAGIIFFICWVLGMV